MEGALHTLAGKIMRNEADPFAAWTRTDSIPFDASHRYMAVLHHNHEGQALIHVKGAPRDSQIEAARGLGINDNMPVGGGRNVRMRPAACGCQLMSARS